MALGNNYSSGNYSNNDQKKYSPSTLGIRFNNGDSKLDATAIKFDFWNGMLKISIAPKKLGKSNDEFATFDFDNAGVIYLTHQKARMLLADIAKLESDPSITDVGVNSGADGLFSVCKGEVFGSPNYCFIIRKVGENGMPVSNYLYETRDDFYNTIRNYDEKTAKFDKEFYSNVEMDTFKDILAEYIKSATAAMAGSVMHAMSYDLGLIRNNFRAISEKMGISTGSKNYGGSSYFTNNSGNNSSSRTESYASYSEFED